MPKKIFEQRWDFTEKVVISTHEEVRKFLWWSWKVTVVKDKYKYESRKDLLDQVNAFIASEEIVDIVKFENTARWVLIAYDVDYEVEERRGGITLVYTKDCEV